MCPFTPPSISIKYFYLFFFFLHIEYVFTFWFWVHLSTISSHYLLTNNIELENDTTYRINVNGAKKQFILILFHLWMLTFTVHAAIVQSVRSFALHAEGCVFISQSRQIYVIKNMQWQQHSCMYKYCIFWNCIAVLHLLFVRTLFCAYRCIWRMQDTELMHIFC